MALRDEWFGAGGMSDLLRRALGIVSTQEMAEAVQPPEYPDGPTPDEVMQTLLEDEYCRYSDLAQGGDLRFVSRILRIVEHRPGDFPETEAILSRFLEVVVRDPVAAADFLAPLAFHFEHSQSQSRKTRAGTSLELQLEYLLVQNGITKWEKQRDLQWGAGGHTKVDLVFPSVEHFSVNPFDCIVLALQTTSNDRYRSALAQVPNVQKYVVTGIGSVNFGSSLQTLSVAKLDEVVGAGARYVMFPGGKNNAQHMREHQGIITYEELIDIIRARHDSWP